MFEIKALISFKSLESIDFGGVSLPVFTVTSRSSCPFSSVIISLRRLFDAVSIISVNEDGEKSGLLRSCSGNILIYESIFPARSASIYFQALIIRSFFNELNIELFVKVDSPGNSIRRLFELSFHSVAFVLYCAIISSSSIFPNILTYWSIGSERAIFIIWESGCLGSSMLIVSTSLMYDLYHLARFCKRDFLILLTIGIKSSRLVLPSR